MDTKAEVDFTSPITSFQDLGMAICKGQRATVSCIKFQGQRDVVMRHSVLQPRQKSRNSVAGKRRYCNGAVLAIAGEKPFALFWFQQVDLVEHLEHGPIRRYA